MSEAFWWYVLAGFLLGFGVSTLWEWVYFRRRRMTIRDRRIAELEAAVRAYSAASAPGDDPTVEDWAEPAFQNPGVYLETEEAPSVTPQPETLPSTQNPPSVVTVSPIANGVQPSAAQSTSAAPAANYAIHSSPAPANFQSLAVQQAPPTMSTAPRKDAPSATKDSQLSDVLAALGAASIVQRVVDDSTSVEPATATAPDADSRAAAPTSALTSAHINGTASAPAPKADVNLTPDNDSRAITSAEIGVIVSSINELIDTVSQEQREQLMPPAPSPADSSLVEAHDGRYVTRINGRTEYVLVRMVQSLMQFMRQLREILGGAEGARPAIRTAPLTLPADDLTRIAGLSAEQAARLRTAGVTTYTRLAQLSPDELRMITLTPGGATADPAQWQVQARQLATVQSGGERV
jgi:hypothetical protein